MTIQEQITKLEKVIALTIAEIDIKQKALKRQKKELQMLKEQVSF